MSTIERPADREFPILTASVCAICVVIFIAMNTGFGATVAGAKRFGEIPLIEIFDGSYWGLITSVFVHREPLHLLFNLYWFWILGGIFERRFGIPLLAAFFFLSAVVSSGAELATGRSGIGLSGVGYALFGFAWIARSRVAELARVLSNQMVWFWLGWGVFCLVMTQLGQMNVANAAHLGGLVFGVIVGRMYVSEDYRALFGVGLVVLIMASIVPVFWNPRSGDWQSVQALKAIRRNDLDGAEKAYKRSLEFGQDPVWTWRQLALIYAYRHDDANYAIAIRQLRKLDVSAAKEITDAFGDPN
jgi:membrane associated rhomboid family serine protease